MGERAAGRVHGVPQSAQMPASAIIDIPAPLASDLQAFTVCLQQEGLRSAVLFLNRRTSHRYTGVFRFDGEMLRNVLLVDKWDPTVELGDDVPLAAAYCAHLHQTGEPLEVLDGATDARVPWMHGSPIVSYCGAVIEDAQGRPWGALCHFDTSPCDSKNSDMPLIVAAARIVYPGALAAA